MTLKPCPFCGGRAILRETNKFRWVECTDCKAEMTRKDKDDPDTPMIRWNRRVKPAMPLFREED